MPETQETKIAFLIKVLPASAGVPYLIYSVAAGTPLSVGYYTNKPDEKILMASKDDSGSLMSIGWDLLQSSYYKNYYAIQSESYLGQADPNNQWSIFYYVLEAVSGNKICSTCQQQGTARIHYHSGCKV